LRLPTDTLEHSSSKVIVEVLSFFRQQLV